MRHRYSSSESPRPLPPPPSVVDLLGHDDDTPRRVHRAYSLPQEPSKIMLTYCYHGNSACSQWQ